ncbi:hypothetical protein GCM10020256_69830 [Streptomyces thermocoprophilus]
MREGVVALVGLVGPSRVADEGAEAGGGAVDLPLPVAVVAVAQGAEEAPAAVQAGAGGGVHGDGQRPGGAAQGGGVEGAGEGEGVRGGLHAGNARRAVSERSENRWIASPPWRTTT